MAPTAQDLFEETLELIFSKWTLLALAVDQGWGGRDTRQKRQDLKNELVDRLSEGARRRRPPSHENVDDVHDLADWLYQRVVRLFFCETDDNSDDEVAYVCLRLFNTCRAGDTAYAAEVQAQLGARAVDLSRCTGVDVTEYATEEDLSRYAPTEEDQLMDSLAGMEIDDVAEGSESGSEAGLQKIAEDSAMAMPPRAEAEVGAAPAARPEKVEPEVDEDGFTTVKSKSKRR